MTIHGPTHADADTGARSIRTSGRFASAGPQRRERRVDVSLERVVEQIGDKAERRFGDDFGDDVHDLFFGVTRGTHRFDIRVFDVTARRRDPVGELQRGVGLGIGRMAVAVDGNLQFSSDDCQQEGPTRVASDMSDSQVKNVSGVRVEGADLVERRDPPADSNGATPDKTERPPVAKSSDCGPVPLA